jgi:4-amino-4-deoxy-L-arabinose transferase-like glycosyltransferase
MPVPESTLFSTARVWQWRILAASLILAATGLRLTYLVSDCPLDLAPDEAHYWDWSRHLDWSYYSKGPLVAYLIRGSVALTGSWSERLTGSQMVAVRLPAIISGILLLVSLYVLTREVYGRESLAAGVVAAALAMPIIAAGAFLMTIDALYTCCWGWALVLGYLAIFRGSSWAWFLAGIVVGLGILAKYTMVLWIPSLGLFLLTSPRQRRHLCQPGFWIMTATATVCCLPIVIWNFQYNWVGFRHLRGLAGLSDGSGPIHWLGPISYLGLQALLHLGFWFLLWLIAMMAFRPWKERDARNTYLWWLSAPVFVVFLLFSFKTGGGEPNWPVAAYLSGLVLVMGWLSEALGAASRWYRRLMVGGVVAACSLGLVVIVLMHHSEWVRPVLARIAGPPSERHPFPVRRLDPTCRLRGWRELAAEVDRLRLKLLAVGIEPVVAGGNWTVPGELAFYCQGHPTVYSLGLAGGDRHSQYDLWRPNPVADPDHFSGRTVIFIGDTYPALREAFQAVESPKVVTYLEDGYPVSSWTVTVCRGFRGFGKTPMAERY